MKKKTLLLAAITSILLASCGGSGWSCKKRYCDVNNTENNIVKPSVIKTNVLLNNEDIACN